MKYSLLLGKNYHSFLISFALLERNKKVVLIDDPNKKNTENSFFFDYERVLLETWGLDCDIPPLLNLDAYLSPRPYCLIFDGIYLNLGGSPSQNYNEVLRKLPGLFGPDPLKNKGSKQKFDNLFNSFSENFGVKLFRFVDRGKFNFDLVWKLLPLEIQKIFLEFKVNSSTDKYRLLNCFFQGVYQNIFSLLRSDFEILFLLLFILSPRFEVNTKELEEDLARLFKKRGGEIMPSSEISFQIKGKEALGFSMEGMESKRLEKIFLSSGKFGGVSLTPNSDSNYTSIRFRMDLKLHGLENLHFFISDRNRVGGINPLTQFKFEKDHIIGEVLLPYTNGAKESFEDSKALEILLLDLKIITGVLPQHDFKYKGFYTQKFWYQNNRQERPELNWAFIDKPVKNLKIYHPSISWPLGHLSMLAQIKDERGHIL